MGVKKFAQKLNFFGLNFCKNVSYMYMHVVSTCTMHMYIYCYHVTQVWLQELSDNMKMTLQQLLVQCVQTGRTGGTGINPYKYPSQVGVAGIV